ncbi:MAG: CHAT domain-containing protein [Chloroflexales bacterium]|nr:CHAT domain-containing protein [Chloroflexales bacterium]
MYVGQWQIAQNYFNQSIQLHESLKTTSGLAYLYWSQGFLFHILGNEARSEAAYLQALSIAQSPSYSDLSTAIDTFSHLGLLYQTQHRWEEALDAYIQERILATQLKREHWRCMTYYRCGNIFKLQGRFAQALDAYREAIAGIENLRESTEGDEVKIGLLGTVQQVYEAMVLLCLEQGYDDDAYHYVEQARSRAFLDALAKKAPELFAAIDQPVVTLAEVQAQLPDGALLIEYYTTGVAPRGEHLLNKLPPENKRLREHLLLPPRIIIFAISRDHFSVHTADLDPNQLQPNPGAADPSSRFLDEALLNYLSERLLGPVADLLPLYSQLFLIPHGPLHYVPFQALQTSSGDYLLSAAGPNLAFAPSATVLLRNCFRRQPHHDGDLLALGYDDTGDLRLRYAEAEANYVAQLMGGQAWTGTAPKRDRLAAASQQLRQLHIASHAVYNPRDPLGSELRIGAEDTLSARDIIGGMELRAELATLSACTSGLSHVVAGDELLGLQRAFLYAGAPTVICTLWDVVDLVALLVMERFYTNLRQGQATAMALRDAQVMLREMTGRDLETIIARWRDETPELATALDLPTLVPEQRDEHILADPCHWAAFLLIGKPS